MALPVGCFHGAATTCRTRVTLKRRYFARCCEVTKWTGLEGRVVSPSRDIVPAAAAFLVCLLGDPSMSTTPQTSSSVVIQDAQPQVPSKSYRNVASRVYHHPSAVEARKERGTIIEARRVVSRWMREEQQSGQDGGRKKSQRRQLHIKTRVVARRSTCLSVIL